MVGIASRQNGLKGGRPKGALSQSTIEKKMAQQVLRDMVEENLQPIVQALINRAQDKDTTAAKELFDRAWGKASQPIDITTKGEKLPDSTKLDELIAIAEAKLDDPKGTTDSKEH